MKEKRNITIIDKKQIPSEEPARQYYFMDIAKNMWQSQQSRREHAHILRDDVRVPDECQGFREISRYSGKIGYVEAPDERPICHL